MGLPTNEEQNTILDWYERQRGGVTTSVKKAIGSWAAEYGLIEMLMKAAGDANKAREDAAKAWKTAERYERRQLRAYAAANSAYQMDVKEAK